MTVYREQIMASGVAALTIGLLSMAAMPNGMLERHTWAAGHGAALETIESEDHTASGVAAHALLSVTKASGLAAARACGACHQPSLANTKGTRTQDLALSSLLFPKTPSESDDDLATKHRQALLAFLNAQ